MTNVEENTFHSEVWGCDLVFVPTKSNTTKATCNKCLLNEVRVRGVHDECMQAKCMDFLRSDKRNGYFTKHDMPKEKGGTE